VRFVGTRTDARTEMAGFVRNVLGFVPADISAVDADMFELADGSSFAVAAPDGMHRERPVGRLDDVDQHEARSLALRARPQALTNLPLRRGTRSTHTIRHKSCAQPDEPSKRWAASPAPVKCVVGERRTTTPYAG
jgi:glyoxylase I family protein